VTLFPNNRGERIVVLFLCPDRGKGGRGERIGKGEGGKKEAVFSTHLYGQRTKRGALISSSFAFEEKRKKRGGIGGERRFGRPQP